MPLQLTDQYFICNDVNPTTQVWSTPTGAMVANNAAAVLTWLNAADGRADAAQCGSVLGTADNGAGLIRVQVDTTANLQTGQVFNFVGNNSGAAGAKAIAVIDATHFDIVGSVWSINDTTGIVWAPTLINTQAGVFTNIDNYNEGREASRPGYLAVSSAVNYTMTNPAPEVLDVTMTGPGLRVRLPIMNVPGSVALGRNIVIRNAGGTTFSIRYQDDATVAFSNVLTGEYVTIFPSDNSTQNGTIFGRRTPTYPLRGLYGGFGTTFTNSATNKAIPIADGSVWNERVPSGDIVNDSAGVFSLVNIPTDTPMAGDLLATAIAAPSTPAAGEGRIYEDSTSKNLCIKDDAGVVKHGVQTISATTSQWVRAIDDAGAGTTSQPASTDLSDTTAPTSHSPTDQSGAGLTFTNVSVQYTKVGNMVYMYGTLTYPATASGANASISLPVAVPNQNYATVPGETVTVAALATPTLIAVKNTSRADFFNQATQTNITNAQLTGALVRFVLIYPAT